MPGTTPGISVCLIAVKVIHQCSATTVIVSTAWWQRFVIVQPTTTWRQWFIATITTTVVTYFFWFFLGSFPTSINSTHTASCYTDATKNRLWAIPFICSTICLIYKDTHFFGNKSG